MQLIIKDLYLKKMKINLKNNKKYLIIYNWFLALAITFTLPDNHLIVLALINIIINYFDRGEIMAKEKVIKTNAMRILDSKKVNYEMITYESKDGKIDGISVAHKIGVDETNVFKTLVAQGTSKELYVFVIPVAEELNLKEAALITSEKKIEMINVNDIMKYTGYIRGGCSPIGQKREYKTFIHESAKELDFIIVSAGKIGYQIKINPNDLINVVSGKFEYIIK